MNIMKISGLLLLFYMLVYSTLAESCIKAKSICNIDSSHNNIVIALNDSALKLTRYINHANTKEDTLNILKGINLLNEAIRVDSNYLLAYYNKINLLLKLRNYQSALKELNKVEKVDSDAVRVNTIEGMIYEKTNDIVQAHKKYKNAIEALITRKVTSPFELAKNKINIAYLKLFLEGKESAKKALEEINNTNPKIKEMIENMNVIIEQFNRMEFFNDY